jgi:hypothetical protein
MFIKHSNRTNMNKPIRKTYSLDLAIAAKIEKAAKDEDRTESAVVNRILRKAMEAQRGKTIRKGEAV